MAALVLTILLGPRPSYPDADPVMKPLKASLTDLDAHVADLNSKVPKLKPNNEGRILWANDTNKTQTDVSILFLHGFSASPREAYPMVPDFAGKYGCNAYLPLLEGHGIDSEDSFQELTPADLIHSARDALAVSQVLGKRTIVVGSSTGCTLAIYLAAMNPEAIDGMYLFSPNIDLADPTSRFLLWPWGLQMGRMVVGKRRTIEEWIGTESEQYWTMTYRTEGIVALKYLLKNTMTDEVFAKVKQPVYASYYYKDDSLCDHTISIPEIKRFYENLGTPAEQKKLVASPDAGGHVMTCDLRVKPEVMEGMLKDMSDFGEKVLGMEVPVVNTENESPDSLISLEE